MSKTILDDLLPEYDYSDEFGEGKRFHVFRRNRTRTMSWGMMNYDNEADAKRVCYFLNNPDLLSNEIG